MGFRFGLGVLLFAVLFNMGIKALHKYVDNP